jgi:hypothetical protein
VLIFTEYKVMRCMKRRRMLRQASYLLKAAAAATETAAATAKKRIMGFGDSASKGEEWFNGCSRIKMRRIGSRDAPPAAVARRGR